MASSNPFARRACLSFSLEAAADVRLAGYGDLGREVAVLVDSRQKAGAHTARPCSGGAVRSRAAPQRPVRRMGR